MSVACINQTRNYRPWNRLYSDPVLMWNQWPCSPIEKYPLRRDVHRVWKNKKLKKRIPKVGDRTVSLRFLSQQRYRLSYVLILRPGADFK